MQHPPNTRKCKPCKGKGRVKSRVPGGAQCFTCRGKGYVPDTPSRPDPADPNSYIVHPLTRIV